MKQNGIQLETSVYQELKDKIIMIMETLLKDALNCNEQYHFVSVFNKYQNKFDVLSEQMNKILKSKT